MHNILVEKQGEKENKEALSVGLTNLAAMAQIQIGALKGADQNIRRAINLGHALDDEYGKAIGRQELGRLLSYRGAWMEAERIFATSLKYWNKTNGAQGVCLIKEYSAVQILLMARTSSQSPTENILKAIQLATQALEMAEIDTQTRYKHPVDYMRAYWLLGAAFQRKGDLVKGEENLLKALEICRQKNIVNFEADILLELAKLRYGQEKPEEAKTLAEEALLITERSGYVLQGADVHLFLATLALEQEKDKGKARELAERAKEWAYCDGGEYKYKVAYEEAERFLEKIK